MTEINYKEMLSQVQERDERLIMNGQALMAEVYPDSPVVQYQTLPECLDHIFTTVINLVDYVDDLSERNKRLEYELKMWHDACDEIAKWNEELERKLGGED